MPRTPDRSPGVLQEDEEIQLGSNPGAPSQPGAVRYDGVLGAFQMRDGAGVFDPRSGSGLSSAQHRALDQLVHDVAETSYFELTRASGQVTVATWWTDAGKTTKIRETTVTRSSGQVATIVTVQYDGAGAAVETLTGTVSRTAGQVSNISWVKT